MNKAVANPKELSDIYGYWPSFHDGELHRATFEFSEEGTPILELEIHVFEITNKVGLKGQFVLEKHVLVTLRFIEIAMQSFGDFGKQNVIMGLKIEHAEPSVPMGLPIWVELHPSFGPFTSLHCQRCEVVEVRPYIVPD